MIFVKYNDTNIYIYKFVTIIDYEKYHFLS